MRIVEKEEIRKLPSTPFATFPRRQPTAGLLTNEALLTGFLCPVEKAPDVVRGRNDLEVSRRAGSVQHGRCATSANERRSQIIGCGGWKAVLEMCS